MLLSYSDLQQLPADTLDHLIREYIIMQLEDGTLEQLTQDAMEQAKQQTHPTDTLEFHRNCNLVINVHLL